MKRWLWIGGWGLGTQWQADKLSRYWPEATHEVIYPGKLCLETFFQRLESSEFDGLGGYSLGAFLLLRELKRSPALPVQLLAPIIDFKGESARGGRIKRTHLTALLRRLRHDPLTALNDFYEQAGLSIGAVDTLPSSVEDLIWGIEQLQSTAVNYWGWENIRAVIGERDALLNPVMLQELWPDLMIVPNAGHDLGELLKEVSG